MKFKIGDKVRGIKERKELQHGKILGRVGEVCEVDAKDVTMNVCVRYDSSIWYWLNEDQLELVVEGETK